VKVRLPVRLFVSYAAVAAIGAGTAYVAVRIIAPRIFDQRMGMMDGGQGLGQGGQMMGAPEDRLDRSAPIREAFLSSLDTALIIGFIASIIIAGLVAAFVTYRLLRPLEDVRAATRRIAAGDYQALIAIPSEPEMAELATDVNTLATELAETETRRVRLLGDVAHEMRTPLTTLDGYVEGMIDGVFPADEQTLGSLTTELRRLRRLSDDLAALSRAEERRFDMVLVDADLDEIATSVADRLRPQFEDSGIAFSISADTPTPVTVDPDRIIQVLTNLLGNALVATEPGGSVSLEVRPGGEWADLTVRDTGIGLVEPDQERIFERFYRAEGAPRRSGGSGIGLTISREIAQAHGGTLTASSAGRGHGSQFTLRLPLR
jgi:signal transduction histidine kinase